MDTQNIVVIVIGHSIDGTQTAVTSTPAWECENVDAVIVDTIVRHLNEHGTGDYHVIVRPING